MKSTKKISELIGLFYIDEDNILLTIFWNSLYIAFFLLPLGINLPSPFFIISCVLGVFNIFRSKQNFVSDNKALLLFPLYFLIMAITLFYTENLSSGLELLQRSITLLLFPIIFLFVKEDASTVKRLFEFLLIGLLVSFGINVVLHIRDAILSIETVIVFDDILEGITTTLDAIRQGWKYCITTEFSRLVNANYVSIYILLVLSYYLKKKLETLTNMMIILVLFLYLFLLGSWASYLTIIIVSLLLIFNIADKVKRHTMLIVFLLGSIVFLNNPRVTSYFSENQKNTETHTPDHTAIEKSRLLTWHASILLIKEAPLFGYGAGDANDVLIDRYKEMDYITNYVNKYNAHNQFLQTWLQTGLLGLIVLVIIFILLGLRMRRSPNEFSVFLILLISLLFESMLVRFNGIVFFSIIVPLLLKKRSILSSRIIRNISA